MVCSILGAGSAQTVESSQGRVPDRSWFDTPRFLNRPRGGYVTKRATAIAIARAVISEVYGEGVVERNEPFDARRFDDVWLVYSFVPESPGVIGGGYTVQISASTGAVINTTLDQ